MARLNLQTALAAAFVLVASNSFAEPSDTTLGGVLVGQTKEDAAKAVDLAPKTAETTAGQTIAILLLSGEAAGIRLTDIHSNASRAIEANTALNVAPLDVLDTASRDNAVRKCAGKAACFAKEVREKSSAKVDLMLAVSVDALDEGMLLGFRLVDVQTEKELGASGDEVPMGMSLVGAMERQLPNVFPNSIWGQIAAVKIESTPDNAEATVVGAGLAPRSCATPCELKRLAPGAYNVTIKKAGYETYTQAVTLAAKKTTPVTTTLVEPPGGITSSPLFWAGVGAVAIGAGVAAFFLLRPSNRVVNICIADDPALCEI